MCLFINPLGLSPVGTLAASRLADADRQCVAMVEALALVTSSEIQPVSGSSNLESECANHTTKRRLSKGESRSQSWLLKSRLALFPRQAGIQVRYQEPHTLVVVAIQA